MRFAAGLCWAGTRWLAGRIAWVQASASGARAGWPATATAVEAKLQRVQEPVSAWPSWTWLSSEKGEPTNNRASNIARAIRPFPFIRASSSRQTKIIGGLPLAGCSRVARALAAKRGRARGCHRAPFARLRDDITHRGGGGNQDLHTGSLERGVCSLAHPLTDDSLGSICVISGIYAVVRTRHPPMMHIHSSITSERKSLQEGLVDDDWDFLGHRTLSSSRRLYAMCWNRPGRVLGPYRLSGAIPRIRSSRPCRFRRS